MRVLGVSGSLRRTSYNTGLLRAAADAFGPDIEFEIWGGLKTVPPYDEEDDIGPAQAPVADMRATFAGVEAVLFATPEYNSSVPGQLKNALDWISRPLIASPLRNKPVAVVGASNGMFGAVWSQAELRKVLAAIGARVLDLELPVGRAATRFDADGVLVDEEIREQLAGVASALVAATREREEAAAAA